MRITCPSCGVAGRLKQAPTAPIRCPKCKERWDPRARKGELDEERTEKKAGKERTEKRKGKEPPREPRKRRRQEPRRAPRAAPDEARDPEPESDDDDSGDDRKPAPRKRRGKPAAAPEKGSPERAGGRRRRGRRRRSSAGSVSGEGEDRGRRGSRRRRSKATLPLIVAGIALVLVGAVGGTVWFLQRRGGGSEGGATTLRARAEGYVHALRTGDADAMFGYLHPDDVEQVRQKQGQAGVDLLKSLLGLGANMFKSAQQAGAKVQITISKTTTTGDRGTVELLTRVDHEGKTQSRTNSMGWVRRGDSWYLSSPGASAAGKTAGAAGVTPPAVDETPPAVDETAPDETAPDADADVDITAPD